MSESDVTDTLHLPKAPKCAVQRVIFCCLSNPVFRDDCNSQLSPYFIIFGGPSILETVGDTGHELREAAVPFHLPSTPTGKPLMRLLIPQI